MTWLVHSEWLPGGGLPGEGISLLYGDQESAERAALRTACCAGARSVAVEGPGHVITLDWDRYSNVARRYGRYIGVCGNEREPDGEVCVEELYARPADLQVRCPACGAWQGVRRPVRRRRSESMR